MRYSGPGPGRVRGPAGVAEQTGGDEGRMLGRSGAGDALAGRRDDAAVGACVAGVATATQNGGDARWKANTRRLPSGPVSTL